MEDAKPQTDRILICVADGLKLGLKERNVLAVKSFIVGKTLLDDVELVFDDARKHIVISAHHGDKFFSKCVDIADNDPPAIVFDKFWGVVQEAENFAASAELRW